jgi:phage tail-like protein
VSFSIPPVLLPVYGFSGCSLPSISLEMKAIKEGNYEYPRKVISGASVGTVTLEQGVSIFNSDFYDWVRKAVVGRIPPKNLLLVQFSRMNPVSSPNVLRTPPGTGFLNQAFGNLEFAARIPGRAWLFKECRPTNYRPGSDFAASSGEVSIASLELEMEEMEEFNLGA